MIIIIIINNNNNNNNNNNSNSNSDNNNNNNSPFTPVPMLPRLPPPVALRRPGRPGCLACPAAHPEPVFSTEVFSLAGSSRNRLSQVCPLFLGTSALEKRSLTGAAQKDMLIVCLVSICLMGQTSTKLLSTAAGRNACHILPPLKQTGGCFWMILHAPKGDIHFTALAERVEYGNRAVPGPASPAAGCAAGLPCIELH